MQENKKEGSFLLSAIAIIFIFAIVCVNTNQSLFYTPGPFEHLSDYFPFLALNLCAFLCSLSLQAEEILKIYRKRESLVIRWELIGISVIYFLLGFEKYLCLLLIPTNQLANLHFGFGMITEVVFLADNVDIVFMFAAGVLFIRAFQFQDALIEKKQRKKYSLLYISLIPFAILLGYLKVLVFINIDKLNIYSFNFLSIISIIIYSLILQTERIIPIVHMRKMLQVHWELLALSIVSIFLTITELWMARHLYKSSSPIVQSIIGSVLWQIAYPFAAGMFFTRAFSVKFCQDDALGASS